MARLPFVFHADRVNPGRLLSMYLVHGCLYYDMAQPVISDAEFDELARALASVWPTVVHVHRHLVDERLLAKSGSCYYLSGKFPPMVQGCARRLLAEAEQQRKRKG